MYTPAEVPMILDLREIFASDGLRQELRFDCDMSGVEIAGGHPFTSPVSVVAVAENKAGIVTLYLDAEFDFATICDRCCEPIERRLSYHFPHKLIEQLSEDVNDEYIETPELMLDLGELCQTDILLELPSKFLCREDCQGLCQKCGRNLNLGDCGCDKRTIDPRLEKLRELLD